MIHNVELTFVRKCPFKARGAKYGKKYPIFLFNYDI
jgi:hypothetical protein